MSIGSDLCFSILNLDSCYESAIAGAAFHLKMRDDEYACSHIPPWREDDACASASGAALAAHLLGRFDAANRLRIDEPASDQMLKYMLEQFAPAALLAGCTVQNFTNAANCHELTPSLIHAVHSWQVGGGRIEKSHANQYRHLLESVGIHWPGIRSARFAEGAQFTAAAWDIPAYRLSLSLFPRSRRAEVIGAGLFEVAAGIDRLALPAGIGGPVHLSGYHRVRSGAGREEAMAAMVRAIELELAPDNRACVLEGIVKGFMTSCSLHTALLAGIEGHLRGHLHQPHHDMVRLMSEKARYAVGYHSKLKIDGASFESLIVTDPIEFVHALGRSRWVKPGDPGASLLLGKLTSFGGPMFRVFSEEETVIIETWIRSLPAANGPVPPQAAATATGPACALPAQGTPARAAAGLAENDRELYHRLLNNECCPSLRAAALDFVETWFARSAARLAVDMPFRDYSHRKLRNWFENEALRQVRSYSGTQEAAFKSREEVIDDALQLSPMIFIDGAWLQRWSNAGLVETRVGSLLYKIFSDEIGNGNIVENHPNIYRALMDQMGADLPDFRSIEFAYSEKFEDDAFAVPAFWLSLSQFPTRFIPETLGINLAMELSGVGDSYRTARDELKWHGFSTLFVELHNTIDNVSSGHSAMAVEAIEHHMEDVITTGGAELVAEHWRRVWTGYSSLSKPEKSWREIFRKPRYTAGLIQQY